MLDGIDTAVSAIAVVVPIVRTCAEICSRHEHAGTTTLVIWSAE